MYGLSGSFFTNDKVVLGAETCQRTSSPSNTREGAQRLFPTPTHTIGTKDLLIFIDGRLQQLGVDYIDKNSEEIEMLESVGVEYSYDAILINSVGEGVEKTLEWVEF